MFIVRLQNGKLLNLDLVARVDPVDESTQQPAIAHDVSGNLIAELAPEDYHRIAGMAYHAGDDYRVMSETMEQVKRRAKSIPPGLPREKLAQYLMTGRVN